MFGWNQKRVGLTIAVTCIAGCASSDFHVRPSSTRGPIGARDSGIANAKQAPAPSILPQTHFAAGKLFESQGLSSKAILQYRKAVAVNHHYAEAHERLALLLSRIGRHEEAVRTFRQALKIKPRDPTLQNNLGFELLLTGKVRAAEKAFEEAISLDGTFARAYVNLGIAQGRQRRFDEALATFQSVLPEADAYYNLALVHRGQGDLEHTGAALRHVLAIDPDFTAAQQQLDQLAIKISAARRAEALAEKSQAAARQRVAAKPARVTPIASASEPKRTKLATTKPQPPVKVPAKTKAWADMFVIANDVLDAPVEPTRAAPKPTPTLPKTTKPVATKAIPVPHKPTKPAMTKVAVTKTSPAKIKPIAVRTPAARAVPTPVEVLAVRPQAKPVEAPAPAGTDVRKMAPKPKTFEPTAKSAELAIPKITKRVAVVPAPSAKVDRLENAQSVKTPTPAIAQPTPTPKVVELLERRHDVAGFQTNRPDLDGPIEILLNEINCINDAVAEAEPIPAFTAIDDDPIDFEFADSSEAMMSVMTPVASAWSVQLSSVAEMLPAITTNDPIDFVTTIPVDDEEPCEEALVIDYVPASDPVRLMGECTSAFDPSLPVVYAEQSFVPQGYDGMGYVLAKDAATPSMEGFTCPAIIEARPTVTLVVAKAPRPVDRGPISSVNRTVVFRDLDASLMVVRNEIACLESADDAIRIAQLEKTKKVPSVRLVSEKDATIRRHDRPSRRVGSATKRRTRGSVRRGAHAAKAKPRLKATGIAPTTKPRRNTAAKFTYPAKRSRVSRRRQTSLRNKSFDRLEGLTQIVANEIRCMADQAFEQSIARRAAEIRDGAVPKGQSPKTGSRASTRHPRKPRQ